MTSLPRGVWHYAILLIFLFAIAAGAAWTTMAYLIDNVLTDANQEAVNVVVFRIWALTMGLMFIAGAFGLWAIQFSAETEGRLRVGQVVDSMDYLNDGLMAVDRKGRITGSNPSLRAMTAADVSQKPLATEVFPCLTESDVSLLLDIRGPNEVQKDVVDASGKRTFRFRSQTAAGLVLILVSDVTALRTREMRKQQVARIQLIGRIARGVAHDFSNILSGISGHASLLARLDPSSAEMKNSMATITREAERGAVLAGHLLEFSHLNATGSSSENIGEHVTKASELVRVGLSSGWKLHVTIEENLPPVALSGLQIEQVVLNTAIATADTFADPGVMYISANRPKRDHLLDVGEDFAAVIVVSASDPGSGISTATASDAVTDRMSKEDVGVMQSVVFSVVEEAGGTFDTFRTPGGTQISRIALPPAAAAEAEAEEPDRPPEELMAYVGGWRVLLARSVRNHDFLEEMLHKTGAQVERVSNMMSALASIERGGERHAIVVDKDLLGEEAVGLLRAILKLCPRTGVVVLCDDPHLEPRELTKDVVFESRRSAPGRILGAMVEAKGMAARRPVR